MAIKLNEPLYIEQSGCWIYPDANNVSFDDRLFIVCDNNTLAESFISSINELISNRSLTAVRLSELADEIITSNNKDFTSASIALLLINKNSCLTLQMGKSRVVHVSPATDDIEYDSSSHILDSYSSKARTQLINRININDAILLTLTDRVDTRQLLNLIFNASDNDITLLQKDLSSLLGKHRDQPPASFLLRFSSSGGVGARIINSIKDINWKWISFFLFLAAVIATVTMLSLNSNILRFANDDIQTKHSADSDTLMAPEPAIQNITDISEVNKPITNNNSDSTVTHHETIKNEPNKNNDKVVDSSNNTDNVEVEPANQTKAEDPSTSDSPSTPSSPTSEPIIAQ